MLTFTGSAAVGWPMKARAGEKKKIVLELGGMRPPSSSRTPISTGRRTVRGGRVLLRGQSCISVQRILVHRDVYDAFRERLLARVGRLRAGIRWTSGRTSAP
jgi:acyl-CoA reductase-like NAD-dependent aldehyde dehydrogenase